MLLLSEQFVFPITQPYYVSYLKRLISVRRDRKSEKTEVKKRRIAASSLLLFTANLTLLRSRPGTAAFVVNSEKGHGSSVQARHKSTLVREILPDFDSVQAACVHILAVDIQHSGGAGGLTHGHAGGLDADGGIAGPVG